MAKMKNKSSVSTKRRLPKTSHVSKMQDVRKLIIERMTKKGLTAYGLAKLAGITEQAIRSYMRGKSDMRGEKLASLFGPLGLEIRPKE